MTVRTTKNKRVNVNLKFLNFDLEMSKSHVETNQDGATLSG